MSAAVSFEAIGRAQADVERVAVEIRSQLAGLEAIVAASVESMPAQRASRFRGAERDCVTAATNLCSQLERIATTLEIARAGRPHLAP